MNKPGTASRLIPSITWQRPSITAHGIRACCRRAGSAPHKPEAHARLTAGSFACASGLYGAPAWLCVVRRSVPLLIVFIGGNDRNPEFRQAAFAFQMAVS